jgi:NAD(P)-dependent dehydrogenase (short-subunit alcohol dehydrogenase family)
MKISEKICLITGANSGIGKYTAIALAKQQATVVLLCRNVQKGREAQEEIQKISQNPKIDLITADFASLQQVRKAAEDFKNKYSQLDILINNAGILAPEKRILSEDGFEMTLAVNHLSSFLLTNLLKEPLKKATTTRIINVSSEAHNAASFDINDLQFAKKYSVLNAYAVSKLANIMFTKELALKLKNTLMTANAVHPGVVATNFGGNTKGLMSLAVKMARPFMISAETSAESLYYLATSSDVDNTNGAYFKRSKLSKPNPKYLSQELCRRFWAESLKMVNLSSQESF